LVANRLLRSDNRRVDSGTSSETPSPKAALKFSQILTAPNQLTLVRLAFLPFIIIEMFEGRYGWALILFVLAGLSDGLDGLLARLLHQQTLLGQYLDPIADKMLLSTVFLVLSILHKIPWKFSVMVFSRDVCIVLISGLLYTIAGLRDFRPSIFGKANTVAQLAAVVFVMFYQVDHSKWVWVGQKTFLRATFAFTIVSALHYVYLVGHRLRAAGHLAVTKGNQTGTSPTSNQAGSGR
jgi:cardiolipin synthase (CMP-forming)